MNSDIHGLPACEVEYENETYCRCHCCDGGIIVYADIHLRPGSGVQNTSDSRHETCCRRTGRIIRIISSLMDGESGRVLYEKDGERPLGKCQHNQGAYLYCGARELSGGMIMFRFLRMRHPQPEVKLGLRKGEQYYLEDLLYSLMLKSHNDTAVAIAEHCGGSVEGFARMLNRKAKQIGCKNTYFYYTQWPGC